MSHAYGQLSESSDNEQTEVEMSRGEGESGAESDRSDPVAVSDRAYLIGTAAEEGSRVERVRDRVCKGLQDVGAWAHTHGTRCLVRVLECEVKALFALLAAALVLFPLVLTLVQARIEDGDARLHARITQLERQQRHDTAAKDAVVAALREEIAALRQTVQTMSETVDAQRIESEANTKLTTTNNATLAAVFSDSTQHGNDLAALQQTVQKMSEAANAQRVVSEANKKLADANSDTLSAVSASLSTLRYTVANKGCRLASFGFSGWANDYDDLVNFKCRQGSVISGVYSTHDNYHEDRKFKFECSTLVCS
eukprot:Rhum_TRINITY_DN14754_c0_g1::Rhum_TRINITY_DN14754_c0_g1_i1::g.113137::m.113137